jgi:hypothetical protein
MQFPDNFCQYFFQGLFFITLFLCDLHISLLGTMYTSFTSHFLILTEQAPPSEFLFLFFASDIPVKILYVSSAQRYVH